MPSAEIGKLSTCGAMHPAGTEILRSLVDAFANLGALKLGKGIHGYLIRKSFYEADKCNTHLETSIINMYIRCGSISTARVCFSRMLLIGIDIND